MKAQVWSLSLLIVSVAASGVLEQSRASAQQAPPAAASGARTEFEFVRMVEMVQEARDYVQRRKELLGGLPANVQPLVTEAQQRLQELRQAVQARDLPRSRRIFRAAFLLFEEIRLRLNEAMDAQDPATTTAEQTVAKFQRAVTQLRSHFTELKAKATRSPLPAIDTELVRIDALIRALEAPPPTSTPTALRQQLMDARLALQAVEVAILDRTEVTP